LVEGVGGGAEPLGAAEGDAIGGLAVEGVVGVDGGVAVREFAFDWLGGEFVRGVGQAGGELLEGVGGDEFGIAAPGVVTGVDPALEIFGFGAIHRIGFHEAMGFGLRVGRGRGIYAQKE